jgi:hypothetical protein
VAFPNEYVMMLATVAGYDVAAMLATVSAVMSAAMLAVMLATMRHQ